MNRLILKKSNERDYIMKRFVYMVLCILLAALLCACNDNAPAAEENIVLSAWKNGLDNQSIKEYFSQEISQASSVSNEEALALSYLTYDFNNDGAADYIVTTSHAIRSSDSGDFCCVLLKTDDGFNEIGMPYLPIKTPQKEESFGFSYFEIKDNVSNGLPDITLYADSIIDLRYDGNSYCEVIENT